MFIAVSMIPTITPSPVHLFSALTLSRFMMEFVASTISSYSDAKQFKFKIVIVEKSSIFFVILILFTLY